MRTAIALIAIAICAVQAIDDTNTDNSKRFLESEIQKIQPGLTAAKDLADAIVAKNFAGFLGKAASAASSYLSILNPLVGLVLSVIPAQPDPTYLLVQRLFTDVNNRFDQIATQFNTLSRQVGFLATQNQFATLEGNIRAVFDQMKFLSNAKSHAAYTSAVNSFKHSYDGTFQDAGSKLYHDIVQGGVTTQDFFTSFANFVQHDRKKTQEMMMGTLNLLMRAATIDIIHSKVTNDHTIDARVKTWQSQINQVNSKIHAIDNALVQNYKIYASSDIDEFAIKNPKGGLSNTDFSNQLYNKLHAKYDWIDWFVIVAAVNDEHTIKLHVCDFYNHDHHGRTIGVTSVAKSARHYVPIGAFSGMSNMVRQHMNGYYCGNPYLGFDGMPANIKSACSPYMAAGSMCSTDAADAHIHADGNRLHTSSSHGKGYIFVFS